MQFHRRKRGHWQRKMIEYKLGKLPAEPGAVKFKLANYIDRAALPKPPDQFGHEDLIGASMWGMLGNDEVGDCVLAGAAHETMMWAAEGGSEVIFSAGSVISDYSAITGYRPGYPYTDRGTKVSDAASYRRKVGIRDAYGRRHRVAAYLALTPGNIDDIFVAMYLFGAVGIGVRVPESMRVQFKQGLPWTVVPGSDIEGGHYIPLVAKRDMLICVTWARLQPMSVEFYKEYCDEAYCYVSQEALNGGKSPEGFDYNQLMADLAALNH